MACQLMGRFGRPIVGWLYKQGWYLVGALILSGTPAAAQGLEIVTVAEDVYALIGPLTQRSPENLGNNATFGFVVTADGVVLIDSGGSAKGAEQIEAAVRSITEKPIRVVINTGGQDHRWFGNAYFASKGAEVIAANAAIVDQKDRGEQQRQMMAALIGKKTLGGTALAYANRTFEDRLTLISGGTTLEIVHPAHAHTLGDTYVWLPKQRILFAGDIVFMDRLLGIGPQSSSRGWLEAFRIMAQHNPMIIVPGHGRPGTLDKAKEETFAYIQVLRNGIAKLIEAGGNLSEASGIEQSRFSYLAVFNELSRRNAQAVFQEMELE